MKKLSVLKRYYNKKLMLFSLLCYFSFIIIILLGVFSTLFSSKFGVTLLINYTNFIFLQTSNPHSNKTIKINVNQCTGRYIYVHDLPARFNDDILNNCSALLKWMDMCKAILNNGLGPQVTYSNGILPNKSWFSTNQYALDLIFRNRMKQYKCLTSNSSLASAIYVPFYAGLDLGRKLFDNFNTSVRDSSGIDLVNLLAKKPEWKYMFGRDHFFVSGRVTWDFMRVSEDDSAWGSNLLSLPEVLNMTMLTIESSPWGSKDFAIPHPTYFHPSKDSEVFEWQKKMKRQKRPYLFSFVGSLQKNVSITIRDEIIKQCVNSGEKCAFLDCNSNENDCQNPVHVMKVLTKSSFCLEPAGDSFTRRSTFDSILAGCIPVFFHQDLAYSQFKWYLPKDHTSYSVFIAQNDIWNGNASIEQILMRIPENKVFDMREEVIKMIPRVTYADPRSKLETIEDAFDIAVTKVLERINQIRREMIV